MNEYPNKSPEAWLAEYQAASIAVVALDRAIFQLLQERAVANTTLTHVRAKAQEAGWNE